MLAASANASDYSVDVRVFLIKGQLGISFAHIACGWLVVTYWR
jgi:hypothetical protein